ncbi:MAG: T9SS C-terminal target domain-containing protein [Bacteroidetes bacterium]|nr:MAG: T9SS C-terminal target domain-containing protein [Bacteroidota bacterium]
MMKTKAILLLAGIAVLSVADLISMSVGALNMTGAPGEGNCTGCHGGTANSNTNGSVQISIKDNPTEYVPGKVYEVTVTTSFPGRSKFGFALAARKEGRGFLSVGKLEAAQNSGVMASEFATHTETSNTGEGSKSWVFNWQAPSADEGKITLYAAGVAGNQSKSAQGDFVYTATTVLNKPGSTGLLSQVSQLDAKVFPTIQTSFFDLELDAKESSELRVGLYALNGQLVEGLKNERVLAGNVRVRVNYNKQHKPGIYLIRTTLGNKAHTQKVVLQ